MQAIEFTTKAEDGIIKVPQQYLVNLHGELHVIILMKPPVEPSKKKFTALKLKTKGFKFNRDEANER